MIGLSCAKFFAMAAKNGVLIETSYNAIRGIIAFASVIRVGKHTIVLVSLNSVTCTREGW